MNACISYIDETVVDKTDILISIRLRRKKEMKKRKKANLFSLLALV